jgi:hypothetical protein
LCLSEFMFFYIILGLLVSLVIDDLANYSFCTFEDRLKVSVKSYCRHALGFLLLLFLPPGIPHVYRISLWILVLLLFLSKLAREFKLFAFLKPPPIDRGSEFGLRGARNSCEFDAVARLVRSGNKTAALKLCHKLAKKGNMSPATVSMVRGYLEEPLGASSDAIPVQENPAAAQLEEVSPELNADQLIAAHRYGTAVEILEQEILARPGDFDLFMKYLNVLARHGSNPRAADQALRDKIRQKTFSPEQFAAAGEQLQAIHHDLQLVDEGVTAIKNRKKPNPKQVRELL